MHISTSPSPCTSLSYLHLLHYFLTSTCLHLHLHNNSCVCVCLCAPQSKMAIRNSWCTKARGMPLAAPSRKRAGGRSTTALCRHGSDQVLCVCVCVCVCVRVCVSVSPPLLYASSFSNSYHCNGTCKTLPRCLYGCEPLSHWRVC
jgi:hypothetical protein